MKPVIYTEKANGFNGELKWMLMKTKQKIMETEGIGTEVVNVLPEKIVESQFVAVEVVSGATFISHTIIDAGILGKLGSNLKLNQK